MKKFNKYAFLWVIAIVAIAIIGYANIDRLKIFYHMAVNSDELKNYIESFGYLSGVVFFIFQILQVVIFFIPGEVIQAAGGYIFGTLLGTIISLAGIGVGSYILYVISHKFGKPFVERTVSSDFRHKVENVLKSKNQNLVVFLLYLIPGIPKDSLVIVCALTDMTPRRFITLSMIARIPALTLSSYFGNNIATRQHGKAIVIAVAALVIVVMGIIFKDKVLKKLSDI